MAATTTEMASRGELAAQRGERLERARRALMAAEAAVGVRGVDWAYARRSVAPASPVEGPHAIASATAGGHSTDAWAPEQTGRSEGQGGAPGGRQGVVRHPWQDAPAGGSDWLPVPVPLVPFFAHGAVRRGEVVSVIGSISLLLHLTAALTDEGAWCAIVGLPDLGLAAAVQAGIDPARCVLVPRPGPDAPGVMAALVDGIDVVVTGPGTALTERDLRSLAHRARHRGAVLLSTDWWPGAISVLSVQHRRPLGLDRRVSGYPSAGQEAGDAPGRLVGEMFQVQASGRGLGAPRTGVVGLSTALQQGGRTVLHGAGGVVPGGAEPALLRPETARAG